MYSALACITSFATLTISTIPPCLNCSTLRAPSNLPSPSYYNVSISGASYALSNTASAVWSHCAICLATLPIASLMPLTAPVFLLLQPYMHQQWICPEVLSKTGYNHSTRNVGNRLLLL